MIVALQLWWTLKLPKSEKCRQAAESRRRRLQEFACTSCLSLVLVRIYFCFVKKAISAHDQPYFYSVYGFTRLCEQKERTAQRKLSDLVQRTPVRSRHIIHPLLTEHTTVLFYWKCGITFIYVSIIHSSLREKVRSGCVGTRDLE